MSRQAARSLQMEDGYRARRRCAAPAIQGISYTTTERVVDLGPLKVEAKREKPIPLPPLLGALALAGGVVLVIVGTRRSRAGDDRGT